MTIKLEFDTFHPYASTTFTVRLDDGGSIELDLVEVESIKLVDENRDASLRAEPFRLTFRGGPVDSYLPQQIHTLSHADLGELSIFLVPLGPDSEGMRYEAIFN